MAVLKVRIDIDLDYKRLSLSFFPKVTTFFHLDHIQMVKQTLKRQYLLIIIKYYYCPLNIEGPLTN